MKPSVDLRARTKELNELARTTESSVAWDTEEKAIASKFEGIRSDAFKVLGSWGCSTAVARLKYCLDSDLRRRDSSYRSIIVRALSGWVTAADAQWVAERYFAQKTALGVIDKEVVH